MQCIIHSIPSSTMQLGDNAPIPIEPLVTSLDESIISYPCSGSKSFILEIPSIFVPFTSRNLKDELLDFKNKSPRWHAKLHCWCFRKYDSGFC
jgi:hypothetical protein